VLVKAAGLERLLNPDVQNRLGRCLAALGTIEELHVFIEDQVRIPHLLVALLHQTREVMMALQEGSELLIGDQIGLRVANSTLAFVFPLQWETLEHLPSEGLQFQDAIREILLPILAGDHGIEFEFDFVLTTPLRDALDSLDVRLPRLAFVPPTDQPVRLVVETIARDGQYVNVFAVLLKPLLRDERAIGDYGDGFNLEDALCDFTQHTHVLAPVLQEWLATREVDFLHAGLFQKFYSLGRLV